MKSGMYLTRNCLSAWTEFPASGDDPLIVCSLTNDTIVFSASDNEILLFLTEAVKPD